MEYSQTTEPLHDKDAEEAVLGAMMTDRAVIPRVVSQLGHTPEAFFTTDHQLIYAAVLSCYDRHGQVDALLTAKELEKANHLKRAGGAVFLYDLQARIVETENTEFYAEIIRENWMRRRLIQTSNHLRVPYMPDGMSSVHPCLIREFIRANDSQILRVSLRSP